MSQWQAWYRANNKANGQNQAAKAGQKQASQTRARWTPEEWKAFQGRMEWTPPRYKKQKEKDIAFHRLRQEEMAEDEMEVPSSWQSHSRSSGPRGSDYPLAPEVRGQEMKQQALRIKAIMACMDVLDPTDYVTKARLESQLSAAREFVRGGKAPSVAQDEALNALTEAKLKLETSAAHLETAKSHHAKAESEVQRCSTEFEASKRMGASPRQRRSVQKDKDRDAVASVATGMASTLDMMRSSAQFSSSGTCAIDATLLQKLSSQIMELSKQSDGRKSALQSPVSTNRFNFNSDGSPPSACKKRRTRLFVIDSGDENGDMDFEDISDANLKAALHSNTAEPDEVISQDGYSSLPESLGEFGSAAALTPLPAKFRKARGGNQFRPARIIPTTRVRSKQTPVLGSDRSATKKDLLKKGGKPAATTNSE